MPLQPSLLGANIGNKWIHPSLDTAALHCKPCESKADPHNSQFMFTWKFLKLFNSIWIPCFLWLSREKQEEELQLAIINNRNEHTTCHIRNVPTKCVPGLHIHNMCGFFFSINVQQNPKSVWFLPLKPVLLPKLLWLQTLVPLGVCYSQPCRCQLNSFQEL